MWVIRYSLKLRRYSHLFSADVFLLLLQSSVFLLQMKYRINYSLNSLKTATCLGIIWVIFLLHIMEIRLPRPCRVHSFGEFIVTSAGLQWWSRYRIYNDRYTSMQCIRSTVTCPSNQAFTSNSKRLEGSEPIHWLFCVFACWKNYEWLQRSDTACCIIQYLPIFLCRIMQWLQILTSVVVNELIQIYSVQNQNPSLFSVGTDINTGSPKLTHVDLFSTLLSASLYFSKRGAYWDRLCRDVVGRWLVGWLSRACTVAKRCILGL